MTLRPFPPRGVPWEGGGGGGRGLEASNLLNTREKKEKQKKISYELKHQHIIINTIESTSASFISLKVNFILKVFLQPSKPRQTSVFEKSQKSGNAYKIFTKFLRHWQNFVSQSGIRYMGRRLVNILLNLRGGRGGGDAALDLCAPKTRPKATQQRQKTSSEGFSTKVCSLGPSVVAVVLIFIFSET